MCSIASKRRPAQGLLKLLGGLLLLVLSGLPKPCVGQDVRVSTAPAAAPASSKPVPSQVLRLWPGDAPGLVAGARPEALINERFTNVSVPQLLVYLPARPAPAGTGLIIAAGGGYSRLAMGLHVENVVQRLNEEGIAVFGLKYRTRYGTNDVVADALADGQQAVRLVRAHAREWGLNPKHLGVQGYSAGANLCLNLAGQFQAGSPQASEPLERLSGRPDFVVLMSAWPNRQSIQAYPLSPQSPPVFLAHARDDSVAPFAFAQAIEEKLKAQGLQPTLYAVEHGGHSAFHYAQGSGPGANWPEVLLPWLKKIGML